MTHLETIRFLVCQKCKHFWACSKTNRRGICSSVSRA